jgi:hypothetical protein
VTVEEIDGDVVRAQTYRGAERMQPSAPVERRFTGKLHDHRAYTIHAEVFDHGIPVLGVALRETEHLSVDKDRLARLGLAPGPWLSALKDAVRRREPDDTRIDVPDAAGGNRRRAIFELANDILFRTPGQSLAYLTDLRFTRAPGPGTRPFLPGAFGQPMLPGERRMKNIRWVWPMLLLGVVLLLPWGCHRLRPARHVDVVVLNKTVPFSTRIEHRSLYWLLEHLKIVDEDGRSYDRDEDYLGAFPGPVPGDRPQRTIDLDVATARRADLLYLADTYGVYEEDLASGPEMKAALERSPKIYGGLEPAEVEAVAAAIDAGRTVLAEFNTFASPTGKAARERMEDLLGVRWTRWIGRYFDRLENEDEVPQWMRDNYEREWRREWDFAGAGWVLLRDDSACEVLKVGREVEVKGLTLERERPVDALLERARDSVTYPFWFDVVEARPGAQTLASYLWHVTPEGRQRLEARGLPARFPAVVRAPRGNAYYFAGDFADNPMPAGAVPFAGYPTLMQWVEAVKLAPSEQSFYWRFYVPLMTRIVDQAAR